MVSVGWLEKLSTVAPVATSTALRSNAGDSALRPAGTAVLDGVIATTTGLATLPEPKLTLAVESDAVAMPPAAGVTMPCPGASASGAAIAVPGTGPAASHS